MRSWGRKTDRQTDTERDRERERERQRERERETDRERERGERERERGRKKRETETDRQTDRQTDKQTDRNEGPGKNRLQTRPKHAPARFDCTQRHDLWEESELRFGYNDQFPTNQAIDNFYNWSWKARDTLGTFDHAMLITGYSVSFLSSTVSVF